MNYTGKLVTLRAVEENDLPLLQFLLNNAATASTTGGDALPVSFAAQQEWFANMRKDKTVLRLMVESNEDRQAVGTVTLTGWDWKNRTAELNIKLRPEKCGKGLGTDALMTLLEAAFDHLDLACVAMCYLSYNAASAALAKKLGFVQEGVLRQRIYKFGQRHDLVVTSLTAQDYAVQPWCRRSQNG